MSSPGWFPDPLGRYDHRYFDGHEWTANVSRGGQSTVDPYGSRPTAVPMPASSPPPAGRGFAIAALLTGIGALLTAWVPLVVVVGLALAVLAVVFGVIGRRRARATASSTATATAGMVLGIIGLVLVPVGVVFSVIVVQEVASFIEPGPHSVTSDGPCTVEAGTVVYTGTITNLDDHDRGYTVTVRIRVDGDSDVLRNVEVEPVQPGSTAAWRMVSLTSADRADCSIEQVYGPLPFGIPVET